MTRKEARVHLTGLLGDHMATAEPPQDHPQPRLD